MKISTYHTHSTYSDGKNTLEEMVREAISLGCQEIGFSDHAPMPEHFKCPWSIPEESLNKYVKDIKELKGRYKSEIKIYLGLEQDYFSLPASRECDYILGSVHFVEKDGHYLAVDDSAETMKRNIDEFYDGDVYAYCEDYYALVSDIYNKTKCDIIGHLDLVTKFNEKMPLIDTTHPRYVNAVNKAVDALLQTPAIFEINTGAISRGYRTEPYPSKEIIKRIADSGRVFVINSDTHSTSTIGCKLDEVARELDEIDYKYITSLNEIL